MITNYDNKNNDIDQVLDTLKRSHISHSQQVNPLAPGRCSCDLKLVIFKLKSRMNILSISCEIVLR